ncbi:MCE family protein [Nocardia pseudobrasiliensis]|uniref:Phospholipid/cholesterol/gamma-HCH transport system substrate-binding protein n=1 Tax=Nocardia pseudobrasiliensis TaxID=45979 RepID=A0A370I646_9NOCA|nr:MCE family protein [Nocardia pseudobrasiliensis]RDI66207.1 phospholipid/cholesterol/gamma-HCH transport system substrate-binding protein [Nocardia pseudobrasiliensis]
MNGERSPLISIGVVGIVVAVAISLSALQFDRLPFVRSGAEFSAFFADAGGLTVGDPVQVAGVRSGRVEDVRLDGAKVRVRFILDESIPLGRRTTAAIKTNTILGRKTLEVVPQGDGVIRRDDPIPLERTTSPYSLNDALGDLTKTVQGLDLDRVNTTLDTLSQTFADTPAPLRSALDGVTALSRSLNARDKALTELLGHAQNVTKVLSDRADQINALLLDGNDLLGELDARRAALSQLIVYVNGLAQQLTGFVNDNEAELKPALDKLNSVLGLLQRNKDNLGKALDALGPYAAALGEQVGSGPYFQAYLSNVESIPLRALVDAMVWPDRLPQALSDAFGLPTTSPADREPPR